MRYLILLMLFAVSVKAQTDTTVIRISDTKIIVVLTKIKSLIAGKDTCQHDWKVRIKPQIKACDHPKFTINPPPPIHDEAGCPYTWAHDFRICAKCKRHEEITGTRKVIAKNKPAKVIKDEYTEILNKI